jgi:AcrR family transcriptional regulator
MAFKQLPSASESAPRGTPRIARDAGKQMRSQLLDAAARMFVRDGLTGVSLAQVAQQAGAHASQVSYYFGSKESLFVEVACREVLHAASRAEKAAGKTRTMKAYRDALVREVVPSDGLALFLEALVLCRRQSRQLHLAPLISRTIERLHHEGTRAYVDMCGRRGWPKTEHPEETARRYWSLVFGVSLRDAAMGIAVGATALEVNRLLAQDFLSPA